MNVIRDEVLIRLPVVQGFIIDENDCITDACHLYINERFIIVDTYLFYSYSSKYKKFNGREFPVIEVNINAHGHKYVEHVRIMPEDYTQCHLSGKITSIDSAKWEKRIEPIEKWEKDKLKIEFINPFFSKIVDLNTDNDFIKEILTKNEK